MPVEKNERMLLYLFRNYCEKHSVTESSRRRIKKKIEFCDGVGSLDREWTKAHLDDLELKVLKYLTPVFIDTKGDIFQSKRCYSSIGITNEETLLNFIKSFRALFHSSLTALIVASSSYRTERIKDLFKNYFLPIGRTFKIIAVPVWKAEHIIKHGKFTGEGKVFLNNFSDNFYYVFSIQWRTNCCEFSSLLIAPI